MCEDVARIRWTFPDPSIAALGTPVLGQTQRRQPRSLKCVPTPSKETTSAGLLCDLGPVTQLLWSISALKWWTASAQRSHPHF